MFCQWTNKANEVVNVFIKNVTDPVSEFWENKALQQTDGVSSTSIVHHSWSQHFLYLNLVNNHCYSRLMILEDWELTWSSLSALPGFSATSASGRVSSGLARLSTSLRSSPTSSSPSSSSEESLWTVQLMESTSIWCQTSPSWQSPGSGLMPPPRSSSPMVLVWEQLLLLDHTTSITTTSTRMLWSSAASTPAPPCSLVSSSSLISGSWRVSKAWLWVMWLNQVQSHLISNTNFCW